MKRREFTARALTLTGLPLAASLSHVSRAVAQEKVTLSFLHKWPEPENIGFFKNAIAAFEKAHPNVTIKMQAVADDPYKAKIRVVMASGDIPDIYFTWVGEYTRQFVKTGRALDITRYLQTPAWQDRFLPATLDAYRIDGKLYGVPIEVDAKFIVYNKTSFAKAGITSPPADWPAFTVALNKLKARHAGPIAFGSQLAWATVHYIGDLNAKLVPPDTREADYRLTAPAEKLFTDPGYVEALARYRDFLTKGWFNRLPNGLSHAMARASFLAGRNALMYLELVEFGRIPGPSSRRMVGTSSRCPPFQAAAACRTRSQAHPMVSSSRRAASIRTPRLRFSTSSPASRKARRSPTQRAAPPQRSEPLRPQTRRLRCFAACGTSRMRNRWCYGSTRTCRAKSPRPISPAARR